MSCTGLPVAMRMGGGDGRMPTLSTTVMVTDERRFLLTQLIHAPVTSTSPTATPRAPSRGVALTSVQRLKEFTPTTPLLSLYSITRYEPGALPRMERSAWSGCSVTRGW
jgi:hypothetical protein